MSLYFRGKPACQCQVDGLPMVEKRARNGVRDHYYQLIGNAPQSAGVHGKGGCDDTPVKTNAEIDKSRAMGFWGWNRSIAQGFSMRHHHRLILGCPHLAAGAKFQESEARHGRNGLAGRGRDTFPRPAMITFAAWRRAQIKIANDNHKVLIGGKSYDAIGTVKTRWINRWRYTNTVSRHVYWLQVWLRRAKCYQGPLDGKYGKVTHAAMNAFRKKQGWETKTWVTLPFLKRLKSVAHSSLKVSD